MLLSVVDFAAVPCYPNRPNDGKTARKIENYQTRSCRGKDQCSFKILYVGFIPQQYPLCSYETVINGYIRFIRINGDIIGGYYAGDKLFCLNVNLHNQFIYNLVF